MVRKPDIQYVDKFYVHGSEARVLEFKPARKHNKTVLPKATPEEKLKLYVDPVALFSIAVAVLLLVTMVIGVVQYLDVCKEHRIMTDYVVSLQNENVQLQEQYEAGYDLADIETKALALGMIHRDQVEVVAINPVMPVAEEEPTFWENLCWYFEGLFA